jgi:hypothetical protein
LKGACSKSVVFKEVVMFVDALGLVLVFAPPVNSEDVFHDVEKETAKVVQLVREEVDKEKPAGGLELVVMVNHGEMTSYAPSFPRGKPQSYSNIFVLFFYNPLLLAQTVKEAEEKTRRITEAVITRFRDELPLTERSVEIGFVPC